jgi:hypothetical protein
MFTRTKRRGRSTTRSRAQTCQVVSLWPRDSQSSYRTTWTGRGSSHWRGKEGTIPDWVEDEEEADARRYITRVRYWEDLLISRAFEREPVTEGEMMGTRFLLSQLLLSKLRDDALTCGEKHHGAQNMRSLQRHYKKRRLCIATRSVHRATVPRYCMLRRSC